MVVLEMLAGLLVTTIVLFGIVKIGAPIADAFSLRLRRQFQEIAPESEKRLLMRVEELERQVRELQTQVASVQAQLTFDRQITGNNRPV